MSEAAWDKAFTQGSTALKNRLMKVHANNPKFQSWLKSSGHGAGVSVKQASKDVKPSERVKKLQVKSLQAYGATKGLKVGGEHGSGEMKDTIAPLTRDQHSKIQAAARAAKAAEKPVAAKKTPLTKSQRMAAIAAAVRKTQTKHDVPTMDPDDETHDDLRDLHQALHIRKGYNEEVEQVDEMDKSQRSSSRGAEGLATGNKATPVTAKKTAADALKILKKKVNPVKEEVEQIEEASPMIKPPTNRFDKKSDAFAHVEKHGGKVYKQTYTNSKGQQTVSYSVKKEEVELDEGKMKDIVIDRQETERLKAQEVLGGRVKSKASAIGGAGQPKNLRNLTTRLATRAMKAGHSVSEGYEYTNIGHPPEHSVDVDPEPAADPLRLATKRKKPVQFKSGMRNGVKTESTEESQMKKGRMLALAVMKKNQLKHPIAQEMGEEVVTEAIKDAADVGEYDYEGDMAKSQLRSILVHAKRLHDMLEDQTNLPEWVQSKITLAQDYILTAADYMEGEMNEEVEQVDEASYSAKAARAGKDIGKPGKMFAKIAAGAAKRYGSEESGKRVAGAVLKKLRAEETEIVAEAEGTLAVTPKEKELAAHHGDKSRITYGDVLKARLKSAAEKAMKKGN
jgi:hypothetical protein